MEKRFKAIFILALLISISVTFFAFNLHLAKSSESVVKTRIESVLIPIIGKENFKIEATLRDNKQTIAIMLDDRLSTSARETDDLLQLIRAAIGYDAARGDIVRMIAMPFKQSAFSSDKLLIALEILALLILIALVFWFLRKKPEAVILSKPDYTPTLSDHVMQNPVKAAALMRAWMAS